MYKKLLIIIILFISVNILFSQEQTLNRISISGNKNVKKSEIKKHLRQKELPFYERWLFWKDRAAFNPLLVEQDAEAIKLLFQANGFLYVEVSATTTEILNGRTNIRYQITENEPVRINTVSAVINDTIRVDRSMRQASIRNLFQRRWVESQPGKIFRDELVHQDIDFLNNEFINQGFLRSKTDFKVYLHEDSLKTNSVVDIEYLIHPQRRYYMRGYQIIGNRSVDRVSIRRQVVFRDSLVYRAEYVEESRENLMRLGVYRSIQIFPNFIDDTEFVIPTIRFYDKPKWETTAGVGWGSEENFRAFVQLSHHGIYRRADQQYLSVRTSSLEPWNIQFRFVQPALFHPRINLTVNPFIRRENDNDYILDRYGNLTTISYLWFKDWNLYVSNLLEQNNREMKNNTLELDAVYNQSTNYVQLDINYSYPKVNPFRGVHSISGVGVTEQDFDSFIDYYFLSQELRYYQPINDNLVLALRGQIQTMSEVYGFESIPTENRLYLGGIQSVRGYERKSISPYIETEDKKQYIGGRSSLLFNVEARLPIWEKFAAAVMYDTGQVLSDPYSFDMKQMSQSLGVGFRYISPIGLIRLDMAKATDKKGPVMFHLTIGESF